MYLKPCLNVRSKIGFLLVPLWTLLLVSWLSASTFAQSVDSPWIIYKQEGGLASNSVWKILPTNGEIWFGTDNGVSRFNGEWTSWREGSGFVGGTVLALATGTTPNAIWAGTDRGDLLYWNGELWQKVTTFNHAIQVLQFVDGELRIGTGAGLYIWKETEAILVEPLGSASIQSIAVHASTMWVGTDQGLWLFQRQSWSKITVEDGLPSNNITAIWVDPNGPVWVGTSAGLTQRNPTTGVWIPIETENTQGQPFYIQALIGNSAGEVWGGTDGDGYFQASASGFIRAFSGEVGLTTRYVQTVAIDKDGSIWFGTASGVFRKDQNMWVKELQDGVRFSGINYINTLLVDSDNQLWIGTQGAGIRLKEDGSQPSNEEITFTTEGIGPIDDAVEPDEDALSENVLPDNFVNTLIEDHERRIWAGTNQGIAVYNKTSHQWTQPISTSALPDPVVHVLLSEQDFLWIGTARGLVRYEFASGALTWISDLNGRNVNTLALDLLRQLWVGTRANGLFVQDKEGTWTHYTHIPANPNTVGGNSIVDLSPVTGGGVWAAVNRVGLNYWDGEKWLDFTNRIELPSNLLYTLYTDPLDGALWIGSEGGATRYDGRTWETLHVGDIMPNASIFAIARAQDGSYWFGGKDGLTFYHPEQTPPWIRIDTIVGAAGQIAADKVEIETGSQIGVRFVAGDLHTAPTDLDILYRIIGPGQIGEWLPTGSEFLQLSPFEQTGLYRVELMARDQSFNYSDAAALSVTIVAPPPTVQLPLLGTVPRDALFAFSAIATVALISFAIMSVGIVRSRRRVREALIRGYNPFVSGEPVRREDMFFGRYDLLQRIIDTLHNNSIMIHGERRIGKTTLLYQLAVRLREVDDAEFWFIPLYIDLEGTAEESFFHFLMEEILSGAQTLPNARESIQPALQELLYYTGPADNYTDREFSRDLRDVIHILQGYGEENHPNKHLRMILLLDEMDVMSSYNRIVQQRLRRIFMREFSATLGAVVAGIQISKDWDRVESPWYNLFNEIELGPFDRQQAVELLVEPIRDYYRYEPAAIEFIIDHSDGRPYRLQQYALEAVNHMLADGRTVISMSDVEYAHEHIQRMSTDASLGLDSLSSQAALPAEDEPPAPVAVTPEESPGA
jgi:ligand-binding sensor domain-containing protein